MPKSQTYSRVSQPSSPFKTTPLYILHPACHPHHTCINHLFCLWMGKLVNTISKVNGWTQNPIKKRIGVHPPMFCRFLPCQHFDRCSHNQCMRLGRQFLPFRPMCHVLRASHHVMDRSSMLPMENALRAILIVTENWTSATTLICRNMPGPSPHQWLRLGLRMCKVVSCTHSTVRPHRRDCAAQVLPYSTSVYHVNHRPYLLFTPRHVPQICEVTRMLCKSPPLLCPPQPAPQSSPHGSGSPLANHKYQPLCPSKLHRPPKTPNLAIIPPTKIICGCYNMRESRADLIAKTAITS